jgi:hypothetical protein
VLVLAAYEVEPSSEPELELDSFSVSVFSIKVALVVSESEVAPCVPVLSLYPALDVPPSSLSSSSEEVEDVSAFSSAAFGFLFLSSAAFDFRFTAAFPAEFFCFLATLPDASSSSPVWLPL